MRLLTLLAAAVVVGCGQSQAPADFPAGPDREPQTQRPHTPKPDSTPVPDPVPEDPKPDPTPVPDPVPENGSDMAAFLELCEDDQYDGEGRVTIDALFAEYGGSNCAELAEILKPLNTVSLVDYGIEDITPIATLDKLDRVELMANRISDLRPLGKLKNLRVAVLRSNKVRRLDGLEKLAALTHLVLDANHLTDVSALCHTHGLVWLDIRQLPHSMSSIESGLECIGGHSKLQLLYMDGHLLEGKLDFLAELGQLKEFGAGHSGLGSLDFLTPANQQIQRVYVSNNSIQSLAPLASIESLTHLSMYNNSIQDITPLHGLDSLIWILYDKNTFPKDESNCPSNRALPPALQELCFGVPR